MVILISSFDNFFYRDIKNKKRLVFSARHKKTGSKSKMCSLPSDNLTQKQIRERHGKTIVYNLSKPMDWETFKNIPDHAQEEYLLYLQHQFGATATDISKMLGITAGTLKLVGTDEAVIYESFKRLLEDENEYKKMRAVIKKLITALLFGIRGCKNVTILLHPF